MINYIDRQVIGILKPVLSNELGWSEIDYANIIFYFQMAYAVGFIVMGRVLDIVGIKRTLILSVVIWSAAACAHGLFRSVSGFAAARFALGFGEGGGYPAGIKATRAWFPASERALATGIFNAGTLAGSMVTPFLVPWLTVWLGWPAAFFWTGALGFVWLIFWWAMYRAPEHHRHLSRAELSYIQSDAEPAAAKIPYLRLLRYRTAWAYAFANLLYSPIWWFYLFWVPDFLFKTHGLKATALGPPLFVIYLMADIGSIGGGAISSAMIKRGMRPLKARKLTMLLLLLLCIAPVGFAPLVSNLWVATLIIGFAAAAHQGWTSNIWPLISDSVPLNAVGSVMGFGGMIGALGGMVVAQVTGHVLQNTGSYVLLFMSIPGCYAAALLLLHIIMPQRPECT